MSIPPVFGAAIRPERAACFAQNTTKSQGWKVLRRNFMAEAQRLPSYSRQIAKVRRYPAGITAFA